MNAPIMKTDYKVGQDIINIYPGFGDRGVKKKERKPGICKVVYLLSCILEPLA